MSWGPEKESHVEAGLEKRSLTQECCRGAGQKLLPGHCKKDLSHTAPGIVELSE